MSQPEKLAQDPKKEIEEAAFRARSERAAAWCAAAERLETTMARIERDEGAAGRWKVEMHRETLAVLQSCVNAL